MTGGYTKVAWALLAAITIYTCWGTLRHDYRNETLVGDQASQLMQAVSLAHGGNLGYDATDLRNYDDATWRVNYRKPFGLLFQRDGNGWASAKPYGYSLVVAPFLRTLGPTHGIAVANTFLLLALLGCCLALLRLRLSGAAVPLIAGALIFASNVVPYTYVLYVELFTALLVGLAAYGFLSALKAPTGSSARWPLLLGFAALGFATAEKGPLLIALGPLALAALFRQPNWRRGFAGLAVGAAVFAVAVLPYLATSNGNSYTPYGGERYGTSSGAVPFSDPPAGADRYSLVRTNETVSAGFLRRQLTSDWSDKAQSAMYYLLGRHTGLMVFMPMAVLVIGLALARGRSLDLSALAVLLGIIGYAAFYVLLFSDNFYGGGQAFGNRYFIQICPLVAALAASARIDPRRLLGGAGVAIVWSLLVLWPGLSHPSDAVERIERTSSLQRLFPFEYNQAGAIRFSCGVTSPVEPRKECNARYEAAHPAP